MTKIESINDFVVRFANVNGSGSASANNLFAKAIFRIGVPVSPKNIFPSNIQGLPTWYEVRVNEQGFLGRRGGVDLTVAVNGQTLHKDYRDLLPGGYFVYDSSKDLPDDFQRDDITIIGIPFTQLCNDEFKNPKLRQILRNIIYVGSLAFLLDLELSVLTESITKQFQKKPKLAEPNIKALELGYDFARDHYPDTCKLSLRPSDRVGNDILMDGNSAIGLGAVYAGATVAGWYPITPSTSVVEAFERYSKKFRVEEDTGRNKVAILQAEDELAAIGIVIGASWNGARAFTATSGPGISLMNEFLGLAYFAEIPVVLIDVQRAGPSTGMPTRTQQSDVLACAYASHGDTKNVLLFPCDPKECFEMSADAFDLAERLQTPIIIMSDLDLGMNDHLSAPLNWDDNRKYDRGKVLSAEDLDNLKEKWGRYLDVDGDGICYRTYPGTHPTKGAYFTRGTSHNEYSAYTEESSIYLAGMERLLVKWDTAKDLVPAPRSKIRDPENKVGVLFYGTTTHATYEAISRFSKKGLKINSLRVRAFPFQKEVIDFINSHETIFVIEQNRDAQLRTLLMTEDGVSPIKLQSILNYDGLPITANFITDKIDNLLAVEEQMGQETKGGKA
ncbi:2-oxoacid:acceptor oxidoreductase subunit alpha [Desulforhopalus sp. IMCC35007]|uniref:2-oxoacid:acceptor oxidoreductase subunit alpha n=1 Tax=Desulforhopalus sp. IMCC35007 TaxID=2569543 RepID=UPI0010AE9241|nr:2-oxoacid:acceptor oxidoreductase subunit alpha [Desulforhopalus sp. IMCC35007]TKB08367.1 2-oxoacid:acceptor oxidoreductase subunit alpha [Desulforhopalus sp. IMCC35007]